MRTAKLRQILDAALLAPDGNAERNRNTNAGTKAKSTTGEWSINEACDRTSTDDR